mmetsp:Transcript_4673/g.10231  ORF Transcript_4673/g.10231 Transcript_4673/m.10231 type:complete len:354 (+) Transcript_4673:146-1207(+)
MFRRLVSAKSMGQLYDEAGTPIRSPKATKSPLRKSQRGDANPSPQASETWGDDVRGGAAAWGGGGALDRKPKPDSVTSGADKGESGSEIPAASQPQADLGHEGERLGASVDSAEGVEPANVRDSDLSALFGKSEHAPSSPKDISNAQVVQLPRPTIDSALPSADLNDIVPLADGNSTHMSTTSAFQHVPSFSANNNDEPHPFAPSSNADLLSPNTSLQSDVNRSRESGLSQLNTSTDPLLNQRPSNLRPSPPTSVTFRSRLSTLGRLFRRGKTETADTGHELTPVIPLHTPQIPTPTVPPPADVPAERETLAQWDADESSQPSSRSARSQSSWRKQNLHVDIPEPTSAPLAPK